MSEAVAHLNRGLEVLSSLPGGAGRQKCELGLQLALGQASVAAKGFAALETAHAYARARDLCRELGDVPEFVPALYGHFIVHFQRGELRIAHEAASELLYWAEVRGDVAARVTGHRIVGSALYISAAWSKAAPTWRRGGPLLSRDVTATLPWSTHSTRA